MTNTVALLIGQPGADFRSNIDDLRIYNRAFSDAEVSALYDSTK